MLQEWRGLGLATPVLILTARGSWAERIGGLKAGADDYLTKPFHPEELALRIELPVAPRPWAGQPEPATGGRWAAPGRAAPVRVPERRDVDLTAAEFRLLRWLKPAPRPGPVQGAPGRASATTARPNAIQCHRGPRQPLAAQARPRSDRDPPWPGLPLRRGGRRMSRSSGA